MPRFFPYYAIDPHVERIGWFLQPANAEWWWFWKKRLTRGQQLDQAEIEKTLIQLRFSCETATSLFDCLQIVVNSSLTVSDRLRSFFETEAPGAAEYLPIRIEGPGSERASSRYWIMNWLKVFDCLDEEASINTDDTGRRYVEVPVIDPRRIPPDGVLGVLKGFEVVQLVRNDLRLKLIKAGFTGLWFTKIAHVTVSESINFEKVDWSKKRKK